MEYSQIEFVLNQLNARVETVVVQQGMILELLRHKAPDHRIEELREKLAASTADLKKSVHDNQPHQSEPQIGASMDPLQSLTEQVAATVGVDASAKVLIDGFASRLAAAGTDPAKLKALQDSLKASSDALSAAVAANQPPA